MKIVHSAVGAINESDVTLAAASNAIIIGLTSVLHLRQKRKQKLKKSTFVFTVSSYKAIEEIETAMKGNARP